MIRMVAKDVDESLQHELNCLNELMILITEIIKQTDIVEKSDKTILFSKDELINSYKINSKKEIEMITILDPAQTTEYSKNLGILGDLVQKLQTEFGQNGIACLSAFGGGSEVFTEIRKMLNVSGQLTLQDLAILGMYCDDTSFRLLPVRHNYEHQIKSIIEAQECYRVAKQERSNRAAFFRRSIIDIRESLLSNYGRRVSIGISSILKEREYIKTCKRIERLDLIEITDDSFEGRVPEVEEHSKNDKKDDQQKRVKANGLLQLHDLKRYQLQNPSISPRQATLFKRPENIDSTKKANTLKY